MLSLHTVIPIMYSSVLLVVALLPTRYKLGWGVQIGDTLFNFKLLVVTLVIASTAPISIVASLNRRSYAILKPVLGIAFAVLVSWLFLDGPFDLSEGLNSVLLLLSPLLYLPAILNVARTKRSARILLYGVLLSIGGVYLQAIVITLFTRPVVEMAGWVGGEVIYRRGRASIGGPNILTGFVVITLPLLAYLSLAAKRRITRLGAVLGTGVGLYLIWVGQERIGLVGLAASYATFTLLAPPRYRGRMLTTLVVAMLFLLLVTPGHFQANRFLNWNDPSANMRLEAAGAALRLLAYQPLVGNGFGFVYPRLWEENYMVIDGVEVLVDPHSTPLVIVVETGFLGVLVFIWLAGAVFVSVLSMQKKRQGSSPLGFAGALATLVGFFVFTLTSSTLVMSVEASLIFWSLVGVWVGTDPLEVL